MVVKKLLSLFHISKFDVKYIINEACKSYQLGVVKILLDKADHTLFDVNEAVKHAYKNADCGQKSSLIILLLLSEFDISAFDVKYLMNESCRRCHNNVVKILLEKTFSELNMQNVLTNMGRGNNLIRIKNVLKKFPESKYDLDKCFIVACRYGSIDVAKWLMTTVRFLEDCLLTALRNASRCGRIRVVELLVDKK